MDDLIGLNIEVNYEQCFDSFLRYKVDEELIATRSVSTSALFALTFSTWLILLLVSSTNGDSGCLSFNASMSQQWYRSSSILRYLEFEIFEVEADRPGLV